MFSLFQATCTQKQGAAAAAPARLEMMGLTILESVEILKLQRCKRGCFLGLLVHLRSVERQVQAVCKLQEWLFIFQEKFCLAMSIWTFQISSKLLFNHIEVCKLSTSHICKNLSTILLDMSATDCDGENVWSLKMLHPDQIFVVSLENLNWQLK